MIIQDAQGNDVDVFATLVGGRLELDGKSDTKEWFLLDAEYAGLMVRDGENNLVTAPNVQIFHIGPMVKTPAVEVDGVEVTPAVMDMSHHWLAQIDWKGVGTDEWAAPILSWMQGTSITPNKAEEGRRVSHTTLLDRRTITPFVVIA